MTEKKIQPKNPDTNTGPDDTTRETKRKTMSAKWGGRKLARKSSHASVSGH